MLNKTTPRTHHKKGEKDEKRPASYLKPVVERKATTTIKEGFMNRFTNFAFTISGGYQKFKSAISSQSAKQYEGYIHLLGKKFATRQQAQHYYSSVIWLSYRIIPGMTKQINSDTSWGCLIRVGQMAMAAALKRHLTLKTHYNEQTINANILPAFLDQDIQSTKYYQYSLIRIVRQAKISFDIECGQWFTVSQICSVLDALHRKHPIRGTQNLKTIYYTYSQFFLSEVISLMGEKACNCTKRRVVCPYCCPSAQKVEEKPIETYRDTMVQKKFQIPQSSIRQRKHDKYDASKLLKFKSQIKQKQQKHVLMFLPCHLSPTKKVPLSKFQQIKEFLSLKCSLGIIGGFPDKGLYFLGYDQSDNNLVYLDPHYVQPTVDLANLQQMTKTFFSNEFRKCSRESIDPSMAFVFYIEDLQSLEELRSKVEELREANQDYILSVQWQNDLPEKVEQEQTERQSGLYDDMENSFICD